MPTGRKQFQYNFTQLYFHRRETGNIALAGRINILVFIELRIFAEDFFRYPKAGFRRYTRARI